MANIKLLFCDTSTEQTLEVFYNDKNEVTLWIEEEGELPNCLSFDKSTAAKLVKKLKLEISKIESDFINESKPF